MLTVFVVDFLEPDPCTLSPERGPCTASIIRYYYNVTTQTCQQFLYGGCFPNENNFFNQHDCEDKCSGKHISIAQDFVHYLILLLEFYLILPFKINSGD